MAQIMRTREARRQLYKKFRLSGLSLRESAELAGYAPSTARAMAKYKIEKDLKLTMAQHLDKAGLTDEKISEKLSDIAFNGTRHITVNKMLEEVPDPHVQVKALDLATTLKGHKVDKNLSQTNTQVNINVTFPDDDLVEVVNAEASNQ